MHSSISKEVIKPLRDCLNLVFPPVMPLLIREASKAKPDLDELTRLVSIDPGLTVTVLSLANSSYYGLSQKVHDLKRAIVVLGSEEILKLAISVTMKKSISQKMTSCKHVEYQNWSVILWSAIACEAIAQKVCPTQSDAIYLCALVKDLSLLLLCCSDDKRLKKYSWLCRMNGKGIASLSDSQLEKEVEAWGVDHTLLTIELLGYWGFPKSECQMLADHHDLENIADHDRARQVLILGTFWSEVELGTKGFSRLFQVRSLAKSVFGLDEGTFERLRIKVSTKFNSMCANLGISPDSESENYHEFPVHRIQDIYFAALELQDVYGDIQEVLRAVSKHLYWLWGLKQFEICLLSPVTNEFRVLSSTPEQGTAHKTTAKSSLKKDFRSGVVFYLGEQGYIELNQSVEEDVLAEIDIYTKFLSKNYDGYFCRTQNTTSKARLMDFLPVAVARISGEGRILQANKRFKEVFKFKENPKGEPFWPLAKDLVQIDRDRAWEEFINSDEEKFSKLFCPLETRMENKESPCWHLSAHRVLMDGVLQVLVMLEDVAEISTLEKDIVRQGDYLRGIINSMQDLVFTVDQKGKILFATPPYNQELVGKNFFQQAKPSSVLTTVWGPDTLNKVTIPVEVNLMVGNTSKALELAFNRLTGSTSPQYLIVGRDLTTIRRMEEKIRRQATFDHLTKVYNRYQFSLFLERETQRASRSNTGLGLVFFDLDRFKEFNDKHGHQKGDEALESFGRLLINNSRKGMDFPFRYGGDEFVLLVTETSKNKLEILVQRIIKSFENEYDYNLNLSIGMAVLAEGEDKKSFLNRADRALFKAKNIKGNIFIWAEND